MPGTYNAAPQNHHYGRRKGESVKQERMDLLKDNPVVRDMTSNRPWMSKHFKSTMTPLRKGHEGDMEPKMKEEMKPSMEMPKPEMKDMEGSKKPKPEYGKSMAEAHTPLHKKEKLKMVKNEDGEMVPFYAADGKGKM